MAKESNDFTCSQAQIMAEKGELFKAHVMQCGETFTNDLYQIRDSLRVEYWRLHAEVSNTGFDNTGTQTDAIAKLGQLAIALQSVESAYSALNAVRCW